MGAQVVKDHLQALKRKGNPQLLDHDESLKGNQAKLDFVLSLKVDKDASFRNAMETHKSDSG